MNKFLFFNFFYKFYLYYNLYYKNKIYKKRKTYSQDLEDVFINEYFKNKNYGFYIDIGCYHPIKYSNTALLYNRGWKGINIDMNSTSIDLFNIARNRDINICSAISSTNKQVTQFIDHSYSPVNTIDKKYSDVISKKLSIKPFIEKKIQTYTLSQVLKKYKLLINQVDFLNIDVEAHDYEVLKGIDFVKIKPKIICIEIENFSSKLNFEKINNYLKKYNYIFIKKIGLNGFFEKKL